MTELQKNKKRAIRRKRNLIAREMKMNKAQHEKRIEPKRRREKISVKEAEEFLTEETEVEPYDDPYYTSRSSSDRYENKLQGSLSRRVSHRNTRRRSPAFNGGGDPTTRDPPLGVLPPADARRSGSGETSREDSGTDLSGSNISPERQS